MKFTFHLTVLAAVSGASALIVERDTPVKQVITDVTAALVSLDQAANSFQGNIQPVIQCADAVLATIVRGQATCNNAPQIELADATTLLDPIKKLGNAAGTLYNDIKGRVDEVQQVKQCNTTRTKLAAIDTAAQQLIEIILNKVASQFAKSLAQSYVDDINELLTQTQQLFAANVCSDGYN